MKICQSGDVLYDVCMGCQGYKTDKTSPNIPTYKSSICMMSGDVRRFVTCTSLYLHPAGMFVWDVCDVRRFVSQE